MADGLTWKVEGLAQLEAKLLGLGGPGAKRSVRKGLRAGTNVIRDEARLRVRRRTGNLARNIVTVDTGQTETGWSFAVDVRRNAFYGKFLEFGTVDMPAYPFLRPAAETKANAAFVVMRDITLAAIEQEASR